jgi:hypothetical protein
MRNDLNLYFRARHHEAARAMRDANRASAGDILATARLLDVLALREQPTEAQAALATELSEIIEAVPVELREAIPETILSVDSDLLY